MREVREIGTKAVGIVPAVHNTFFSHAQLSDKRREEIDLRRDQLKVLDNDPEILSIVIEEVLSYKPRFLTIDDRYLQLEKILDAIDGARKNNKIDDLVRVCKEVHGKLSESPGRANFLLKCMESINLKIAAIEHTQQAHQKAKL